MSDRTGWMLSLIALICADERISAFIKVREIKCVLQHDKFFEEPFNKGKTPSEAWEAEVSRYFC